MGARGGDMLLQRTDEDTICAMQVVRTANRDKMEPRKFSCRSVTVAIPTPTRRIVSESWTFLLQMVVKNVLAVKLQHKCMHKNRFEFWNM